MARGYTYNPYNSPTLLVRNPRRNLREASDTQDDGGQTTITDAGEGFNTLESPEGHEVAIPEFVEFNPEDFFISLDEAIDYGHKEGQFNLDLFRENFDRADKYASDTLDTELRGLESFLPRSTRLIRNADAQSNQDILNYSDVFDARNERQTRKATLGNVALRQSLSESQAPGTTQAIRDMRSRAEGDVSRVRARESTSFVDDVLEEQAARAARARGADIARTTGFGVDSSAGTSIIDKFDIDSRLQLEQARREDARRGDTAIYAAEGQVGNAIIQSENLFNTVIAPGIRDFSPLQVQPRVTDIAGQIKATPAVDAGTLRREFTQQQNAISMLAPSQVFSGSLSTQQYNSGVGLQALGFEQEKNNTIAGAANTGFDIDRGEDIFDQQLQAYYDGLDTRAQSQQNVGTTSLITAGLGVLGNLASSYLTTSDPAVKGQQQQSLGQAVVDGAIKYGQDFYNGASALLNDTFGIDIGSLGVGDTVPSGGGSNAPLPRSSGGTDFGGQTAEQHTAETGKIDAGLASYHGQLTQNDFNPGLTDEDYGIGEDTFDMGSTKEAYQPTGFELAPGDTFSFDGGLAYDSNEYVNLARVSKTSSGVEVIPKKEVINSFVDPSMRNSVMQKTEQKGLPTATMLQAYSLYDNWHNMSDIDRATASASLLNNLASSMGVIDGTVPGAVINAVRQGANLFSNWDQLSLDQRLQASSQVVASLGGTAAQLAGIGGPVTAAAVFGAGAFSNAASILLNGGVRNLSSLTSVVAPLQAQGANSINAALGNKFHPTDVNHAALFADPTGIGVAIGAADTIFNLDLDFSSGKPKTQQFRDSLRGYLKDVKFIGPNYLKKLQDGSTFDFGKDGGAKLKNLGKNIDGKTERSYSDVDHSNPIAPQTTAWADVTAILGFRSPEGKRMTGYLWNAATNKHPTDLSNAKNNLKGMASDLGLTYNKGVQILNAMQDQFKPGEYEAFRNSWMDLMLRD